MPQAKMYRWCRHMPSRSISAICISLLTTPVICSNWTVVRSCLTALWNATRMCCSCWKFTGPVYRNWTKRLDTLTPFWIQAVVGSRSVTLATCWPILSS
uniref:Putative secreted protein n=1 Tax=Anopheles marajoara TaxID=58244 RepID=A0A2M4C907_9DIPT